MKNVMPNGYPRFNVTILYSYIHTYSPYHAFI